LLNAASWLQDGQVRSVEGNNLMALAKPYYISPAFAFVAYPNRNSAPYREWYNIPEAETVVRGTLRYQGFPEFVRALVQLGWLDPEPKGWIKEGLTWAEATKRAAGAKESSERLGQPIKTILLVDCMALQYACITRQRTLLILRRCRGGACHFWPPLDRPLLPRAACTTRGYPARHALCALGESHDICPRRTGPRHVAAQVRGRTS